MQESEIDASGQLWLLRAMPLRTVVPVTFLAIAAGLSVSMWYSAPLAAGAGAAVFLAGSARRQDRNVLATLAQVIASPFRGIAVPAVAEPFDVPLDSGSRSGRGACGLRWDGAHLAAMLHIDTRVTESGAGASVPLSDIAKCLVQFDIRLSAADVIAVENGDVWLVLWLSPLANRVAVDNRGGGHDGAIRSAVSAARRAARRLSEGGIAVTILSAAEMARAMDHLADGIDAESLRERWTKLRSEGRTLVSFELDPDRIEAPVLDEIWSVPSHSTTIVVRLRPVPAHSAPGAVGVSAMVRFECDGPLWERRPNALRRLSGAQYRAWLRSVALGSPDVRMPRLRTVARDPAKLASF
ncbi:type VII secretion protein EccE [Nocardia sp. NPDC127526]|uniref:type VII secretion protein EccE n=1 Tax=Nocardia sp. NPDC127526 TaxID=3345393 RepID=UPI003625D19C